MYMYVLSLSLPPSLSLSLPPSLSLSLSLSLSPSLPPPLSPQEEMERRRLAEDEGGQFSYSQRSTQMQAALFENASDIKVCAGL